MDTSTSDDGGPSGRLARRTLTRRDFLERALAAGALAGTGAGLAACGGTSGASTTARYRERIERGGTLTAALTGGTSADTLDAQAGVNNVDFARIAQLYETLLTWSTDVVAEPCLAESMEPNSDATSWTIRLRPGVTFHNGKDLTAEDVIFSLRRILDPKAPLPGAPTLAPIDAAGLKQLDRLTVSVPCKTPFSTFRGAAANQYCYIVPSGYDPKNPVGTGPFRYKSFTPGVQSTFVRYKDYWQEGHPYLDAVTMSDYSDETSQIDALESGEADIVNLLSADAVSAVESSGGRVVVSPGGGFTPFTMRVDVAPFNDVRVRQAMRLIVDRREMMATVFGGHGTIGNDVFSIWDAEYDHDLPQRHQDLDEARFLLRKAGHEHLKTQLVTSDIAQGTTSMAQVLAKQASAAGVSVALRVVNATEFYGPSYLHWVFAQDFWYYAPYLVQVALATIPTAPFNECHFDDPRYNALYSEALKTVDPARQTELAHEMQKIDYDSGGYIILLFPPVIDGYASQVHGVVSSKVGVSFDDYDLRSFWLS